MPPGAIGSPHPPSEGRGPGRVRQRGDRGPDPGRPVLRVDDIGEAHSDQVIGNITELSDGAARVHDRAGHVTDQHRVARGAGQRAEHPV